MRISASCADLAMFDQRFSALHAHARPLEGFTEERLRDADHGRARVGVALRKEIGQHVEAATHFTDNVLVRDEAVLEYELGVVGETLTHLVVHAADGKAGPVTFDENTSILGERLAALGLHEKKIEARTVAVRDEMFHAVDHPAAPRFRSCGPERCRVRRK